VGAAIDAERFNLKTEVERLERAALRAALAQSGGNAALAARLLGAVGRGEASHPGGTVRSMMRRLGVATPRPVRATRAPRARPAARSRRG